MKIITSKQRAIDIDLGNPLIAQWFARTQETQVEFILNQINSERLYDAVLADKEDFVILDFGANIGLFSLYAQDSAKHVYAIEPTPATLAVLRVMCQDNDKITIIPAALSDHDGVIDFYIHDNPTINSVSVNQNGQQISVDAKTIETILKENNLSHVDFVKCDIEGGEMSAITELLLDPVVKKIDRWFVEVHQTNREQTAWPGNLQFNRQKLIDRFIKSGYQAVEITNDTIFAWQD